MTDLSVSCYLAKFVRFPSFVVIELLIPLRKLPQSISQRYLWCKSKITFKGCGISIGGWYITWLHGNQLLMGLEVEVRGKDTGTNQFLLQNIHEIQQVLWLAATDVIDRVGRDGQAVVAIALGRGFLHHPKDAFNNVIHVGEVATAVAVVIYLDGFTSQQLVGEAEVGHIRTTGRTIDGEEAQAGAGDVVKLAVAMRKKLVALLGGGIEAHRIINTVVNAERHFLVATINAAA